jgi:hypothetical protein
VVASLTACGAPAPSGSRALPSAGGATASASSSALASLRPPGGSGTPEDPATVLEHGVVTGATNVLYVTTDGETIVYSGAAPTLSDPTSGPNLYRATPRGAPTLLYAGPRSDSSLLPVVASHGWVAFAEHNDASFGIGAWILWLLPPGASEPIELDRTPPLNGSPYPLVAIDERHVVWQGIALGPDERRAELIELSLPDLRRRVLFSDDPARFQWWDPALDGDRLVYTEVDYVHGDASSPTHPAELHVMLLDLSDPSADPVRLDTSGRGAEPAIHGDDVVWKDADDVFNYGTLVHHSLATGATRTVDTSPQGGIKSPTVGNRYVAFWGIDDTEFFVLDLRSDRVVPVFRLAPASTVGGAFRVEVAADLLVWVEGTEGRPVIAWGRLPAMNDP